MIICGIKVGHDASIALIDNGKLIFCHEIEKIANNNRHSHFTLSNAETEALLKHFGYAVKDLDRIILDGGYFDFRAKETEPNLKMASYGHMMDGTNLLEETLSSFSSYPEVICKSYKHVAGHVVGTYCTSPYAKNNEDAYVLVWDGGMYPQLYYYDCMKRQFYGIANLFPLTSMIYGYFANKFSPFDLYKDNADFAIPGKVMAFSSLGKSHPDLVSVLKERFAEATIDYKYSLNVDMREQDLNFLDIFLAGNLFDGYSSPDILATFQYFIQTLLVDKLVDACKNHNGKSINLCITGGAALNISWNSAIRDSEAFSSVWVPPFPNDSGSAIGTACCEMLKYTDHQALEWTAYSGPEIEMNPIDPLWENHSCSLKELAVLMHRENEPVVFFGDRAEVGPRALGNRSILASPSSVVMKHLLNTMKTREYYRPVAPICIEEDAPSIFTPGTPDQYMLFKHMVKEEWRDKIPAVCHVDGTGRLQTVNKESNSVLYELLQEFKAISSLPVLCNTSANFNGKGFFPDIQSAISWGKVNLIWHNYRLYVKKGHSQYLYKLDRKLGTVKYTAIE